MIPKGETVSGAYKYLGKTNPHPKHSTEWLKWEDEYFREMNDSGEFEQLARDIASVIKDDDQCLVDVDGVLYADIEDGNVFVICSTTVTDESEVFAPVREYLTLGGYTLIRDVSEDNHLFKGGKARLRTYQPA